MDNYVILICLLTTVWAILGQQPQCALLRKLGNVHVWQCCLLLSAFVAVLFTA